MKNSTVNGLGVEWNNNKKNISGKEIETTLNCMCEYCCKATEVGFQISATFGNIELSVRQEHLLVYIVTCKAMRSACKLTAV